MIIENILERTGHEVRTASGGKEALQIHMEGTIDIVVTDLRMPDGDGLELIEALRFLRPETAIIAVSGTGPRSLAEAERKGAFVAISKPIDPRELLEAIANAATRRSLT